MKSAILILTLLSATAALTSGQQPTPDTKTHKEAFRWKETDTQELAPSDRIKVSKTLSPTERAALIKAISAQIRPDMDVLEIHSEKELGSIAADTRVKMIDLNGDGIPEVIAQAWGVRAGCGATGNCPFWVFSKSDSGYKLILGADRWTFQIFTVESTVTNGYHDFILGMHDSASEKTLFIYRFKNGRYHREACYDADWILMDAKGWHELKNPLITACKP